MYSWQLVIDRGHGSHHLNNELNGSSVGLGPNFASNAERGEIACLMQAKSKIKLGVTVMRKLFVLVLIIFTMLCGCNTNKSDTTSNPKAKTNPAKVEAINNFDKMITTKNDAVDTKTTTAKKDSVDKREPIVLYYGITLEENDGYVDVIEGKDVSLNKKLYSKYETKYYLYSDGKYLGSAQGKIEGRGLDYCWEVNFPEKYNQAEVAISEKFNTYPRQINYMTSDFPKEFSAGGKILNQIDNQFKVNSKIKELCYVDLDGDYKEEYLAWVEDERNNFFAKCLVNSKLEIIAYVTVFQTKVENFEEIAKACNLKDAGEIIDINNDGIMEILVELPSYEGFDYRVFTYKNGIFNGEFITKCIVTP